MHKHDIYVSLQCSCQRLPGVSNPPWRTPNIAIRVSNNRWITNSILSRNIGKVVAKRAEAEITQRWTKPKDGAASGSHHLRETGKHRRPWRGTSNSGLSATASVLLAWWRYTQTRHTPRCWVTSSPRVQYMSLYVKREASTLQVHVGELCGKYAGGVLPPHLRQSWCQILLHLSKHKRRPTSRMPFSRTKSCTSRTPGSS